MFDQLKQIKCHEEIKGLSSLNRGVYRNQARIHDGAFCEYT